MIGNPHHDPRKHDLGNGTFWWDEDEFLVLQGDVDGSCVYLDRDECHELLAVIVRRMGVKWT